MANCTRGRSASAGKEKGTSRVTVLQTPEQRASMSAVHRISAECDQLMLLLCGALLNSQLVLQTLRSCMGSLSQSAEIAGSCVLRELALFRVFKVFCYHSSARGNADQ